MRHIPKFFLLMLLLSACGGSETATAPESPTTSAQPTTTEIEPAEGASQESTGSVSDAVIDTSIDTAASSQQTPEELLANGRVIVGDQGGDESESAQVVSLATSVVEVSDFLAGEPDWRGVAFNQGEYYSLELRSEDDERLGWATVDLANEEVLAYFVPRELSPEEFEAGSEIVESYIMNEPQVSEALGDLSAWKSETIYRYQEGVWEIRFEQGDETLVIPVDNWEERYFIDDIYDIVTEATAEANQQTAIDLAKTASGADAVLNSRSDWEIYVAEEEDDVFAVSFTAPQRELFYVRVNIASGEIITAIPGYR